MTSSDWSVRKLRSRLSSDLGSRSETARRRLAPVAFLASHEVLFMSAHRSSLTEHNCRVKWKKMTLLDGSLNSGILPVRMVKMEALVDVMRVMYHSGGMFGSVQPLLMIGRVSAIESGMVGDVDAVHRITLLDL